MIITDIVRYELYAIIDELTVFLNPVGDLILSGGDAVNSHLQPKDRVRTLDIDTKFSPRMKPDSKYFGKLQAVKLLLWNKLGEIAKDSILQYQRLSTIKRENPVNSLALDSDELDHTSSEDIP